MVEDEKQKQAEREETDESLRTERLNTDAKLSSKNDSIEAKADDVVATAREKADSVLSDAREREDRKLAAGLAPVQPAELLGDERADEDAAVAAERDDADAVLEQERARKELTRASLLAIERQETDLRLEIERTRADEALTSREDFLAMVSHDLRSLLSGITMNAGMLKKLVRPEDSEGKAARHTESIERFSGRMNRLIGDLIDVASLEAGQLAIVPRRNDASAVVRESIEGLQLAAAARGVALTCESGADSILVELDHERILQVLANLIGNAIKFTAKGGRVSVRVDRRENDVRFAVQDSGEGIAADKLEQVFERFFQARRNDRRGLGLGLYISKSIVDAHGGKIWAESAPGKGSTFIFTLPLTGR